MGMNIKNAVVEEKVRRVADFHGIGLTEVIEQMADAKLRRQKGRDKTYLKQIDAYLKKVRDMEPVAEGQGSDHSDMYDEDGLPKW